ncbi:MAG: hypothetical protein IKQ29_00285 [Bacilli bacterium]|nr:hypothetical protein [Bacilli bacterium]
MKNKMIHTFVILFLVLVIFAMSIYYAIASYTELLEFNTTVSIKGQSVWNIGFVSDTYKEADNSQEGNVNINGSTLSANTVLQQPGDFYEFSIKIKNDGNVDGELTSMVINSDISDYVDISVKYGNNYYIGINNNLDIDLLVGESETVTIRMAYKSMSELDSLPDSDVEVNALVVLNYNSID